MAAGRFVRYSRMKPSSVPETRGPVVLVRNGSPASAKGERKSRVSAVQNPTTRMRALVADPLPPKHHGVATL